MPILSLGAHYVSEKPQAMAAAWGQMMKHVINYFNSSHTKHQKDLPYKLIILRLLIFVPTSH